MLTAGIEDDTRRQAARWLEQHGPKPPYELAYVGDREYHLDGTTLGDVTMTRLRGRGSSDRDRAALERSAVLALSELDSRRFEDFPRKSRRMLAAYEALRADFPVVMTFRKPFYLKGGFHNPDIELRLRAVTGSLRTSEYHDGRGVLVKHDPREVLHATKKTRIPAGVAAGAGARRRAATGRRQTEAEQEARQGYLDGRAGDAHPAADGGADAHSGRGPPVERSVCAGVGGRDHAARRG